MSQVVEAVRSAEREDPIPSPLTPPVGSLRDDFYAFPDGCTARGNQTKSKVCRLGDTSSRNSIVVFGDSHAQMWMPTILNMAERDHWVVLPLVKVSCIPRTWLESKTTCGAWYRWARRKATALHPDVTLIIGSWSNTWAPSRAIRAVKALTTATTPASRKVIVMDDPPGQTVDPTDCLLDSNSTMKTCSSRQTRTQASTSAAIGANAGKQRAGFLKTRGWFCAPTESRPRTILCPLVVNQTITHVDRGHVSKTYALELAQPFRAAFRVELFG